MCMFNSSTPKQQPTPQYVAPTVATPAPAAPVPVPSAPVPYYDQGGGDSATQATRNAIDTRRIGRAALKIDLVNNAGSTDTGLNTTN